MDKPFSLSTFCSDIPQGVFKNNTMYILYNYILFIILFWIVGLLLRLKDKKFKVSNAVMLGVFLATIMTLQKFLGMN